MNIKKVGPLFRIQVHIGMARVTRREKGNAQSGIQLPEHRQQIVEMGVSILESSVYCHYSIHTTVKLGFIKMTQCWRRLPASMHPLTLRNACLDTHVHACPNRQPFIMMSWIWTSCQCDNHADWSLASMNHKLFSLCLKEYLITFLSL